ncbi:MAG: bifunctional diaminohydroxyphosphoribosylaminopyrimidine deaminase/5-amino-6-(5-phosphoribosylamino)uracil reductase RibD, partial [Candidatus Eisenbacteria bacterium]|nr:bifunctional diaminohydroxyphosphoribosylaminopyrimidine deaminase/5-amino-6-(5-phosphoribosylamino)uracil reductase RibD [Candidatus Eisenbacteria bacterium]
MRLPIALPRSLGVFLWPSILTDHKTESHAPESNALNQNISDKRAMQMALALARRGMGAVFPNPPVGAVVVKDGAVVGRGFHQVPGEGHAEVNALKDAGAAAEGATLFVTLEPCNHQGKTPPCTEAILQAGIRRVVIARRDPNRGSNAGAAFLAAKGIDVSFGFGARESGYLLSGFAVSQLVKRPRFTLKVASSLDGKIASPKGDSKWISSPASRAWVHRRRREADAIAVGAETVLRDNPALTTRAVKGRSPHRIVFDSTLRTSPKARVYGEAGGVRRFVITTERAPKDNVEAFKQVGVEILETKATEQGRVDLVQAARLLGELGMTNVLVEGGGHLGGALLKAGLIDQIYLFQSRNVLLGGGGPGWAEGLEVVSVPRAVK